MWFYIKILSINILLWSLLGTKSVDQALSKEASSQAKIDFKMTILPILQRSCFICHVPSPSKQAATDSPLEKRRRKEIANGIDDFLMGPQFPFPDEHPAKKQLNRMEKKLRRHLMPPETQTKLDLGKPLSDPERKILLDWIAQVQKTYDH